MLESLNIKNYAIIENTSLSFNLGFNVLIGETGAGKSIILDALRFVLGDKPTKDIIRNGTTETNVKAVFSNLTKPIIEKLNSFQIENEDTLIISRTYNIEGKSHCLINGEPVTVGMVKQLAELLINVYGQHENLLLLNVKNHIKMLDSYCCSELSQDKNEISILLKSLSDINSKIASIGGTGEDRERKIDLLNYQINEIKSSNLKVGEDEQLSEEILIFSNYEKISTNLNLCYETLLSNNFSQALGCLSTASSYDEKLTEVCNRLNSCLIEVDDITSSIKGYISNMSFSERDLDLLTERLECIKNLKKKYGPTIEDVLNYLNECENELDNILNCEVVLEKLSKQKENIINQLYEHSVSLHNKRVKAAKDIERKVEDELKTLNMKNTKFSIKFEQLKDLKDCTFTNDGIDNIEFFFSANVGEQQKSLIKTVSGGEMSRLMLAFKNVFADADDVQLLVFDEIDSGVSGEVGYKVGQKLATLSKKYQILCITHLPQVTALADKFIFIKKFVENNHTKSVATYLNEDEIAKYLVSLFGSQESEAGLNHAKELLTMAKAFKQGLNK